MISRNICQTSSHPNMDMYQIVCDCQSDDHNLTMVMEVEDGMIELRFYKKLWAKAIWCPVSWGDHFRDWYGRLSIAWNVLTKGYAEHEADFLIQNEQAIDDLIEALSNSKLKMVLQQEQERKKHCTNSEKQDTITPNQSSGI